MKPPIKFRLQEQLGDFSLSIHFDAPGRGVTALFGPSGSGKTTVLRCMAGLHQAKDATVIVGEEPWQVDGLFRPTHERAIGYVFQEASLFAHLDVRGNLNFARIAMPKDDALAFDEVVQLLGLEALLARSPQTLSGGERQRVAIGRALLSQPQLLLMDEPLSALDQASREEILPFLEQLHDRLALPIIYVSHDLREVERLADHIVLLDKGRVIASGPLSQVQSDPDLPLASMGEASVNILARIIARDFDQGLTTFAVDGGTFALPGIRGELDEFRRLRIRAGDVSLAREMPSRSSISNILRGRILEARRLPDDQVVVVLGLGEAGFGERLLARITRHAWDDLQLSRGLSLYVMVKGVALVRHSR